MKITKLFSKTSLALIAGFVFVSTFLASNVQASSISNLVTFNNTSDLSNYFNPDASPQFTNVATEGIGNTGAINVPLGTDDIWTTKQGYSVSGSGDKYTFSAYFKIQENNGYGGLGFTNVDVNSTDMYGSPEKGVGVMFHGGGGGFVNNLSVTNLNWYGTSGDLVIGNWYKMIFEVTAKGSNTYDLKLQIWNSDADGVLGALFTEKTQTDVVNSDIGSSSVIYGYFSAAGSRMEKIDDFLINLEGGATFVEAGLPVVLSSPVSSITDITAVSGGTVTDEQSAAVSSKGVCWNIITEPPTASICSNDGSGLGSYTSNISGLSPGTTYIVRAYAINSQGTSYGSERVFSTTGIQFTPTSVPTNTPTSVPTSTPRPKIYYYSYATSTPSPTPTLTPTLTPTPTLVSTVAPTLIVLPKTGKLEVEVLGADGSPIKNSQVTIDGKSFMTDAAGKVDVSALATGKHIITYSDGGQMLTKEFVLSAETTGAITVNIMKQEFDWIMCIGSIIVILLVGLVIGVYYNLRKTMQSR